MGAVNARLIGEYFDGVASHSPMKADHYAHHRTLDVDPRSPSSEITRTPIQVDKTPAGPSLIDPRSPSCGISRTPLYPKIEPDMATKPGDGSYIPLDLDQKDTSLSTNESSDFHDLSDRDSSLHTSASSPSFLSLSDDFDLLEVEEDVDELQRSISDPELNADQICLLERSQSDTAAGLDLNMKTFHQSFRKKCTKAKQIMSKISPTHKAKSTSTPSGISEQSKPRARQSLGDISAVRSPLATKNVDINSPLSIVQRKQAGKLGLFRRHSTPDGKSAVKKYGMVAMDDKENLRY